MNETTTLPLDFAPLREGAVEMARELRDAGGWVYDNDDTTVDAFTRLLSDLTLDATRDRWVRWGIERDTAAFEAEADVKWARVVAEGYHEDVVALLSEGWERAKAADRRDIRAKWSALRDDPEALRAAILAALETR